MPVDHVIRLREPWEMVPLSTWRQTSPGQWEQVDEREASESGMRSAQESARTGAFFFGRVRYVRRFGLPSNLEARQSVWLVIEGPGGPLTLELNGKSLVTVAAVEQSGGGIVEAEVTRQLNERNELAVTLELPAPNARGRGPATGPPASDGPVGQVRLEIRAAAK